ncbi:MAG: hypothetical protein KAH57_11290 [Thermoplasmata archaeon]|nr:hypothetical protein [Thermoplasmata archaeon]
MKWNLYLGAISTLVVLLLLPVTVNAFMAQGPGGSGDDIGRMPWNEEDSSDLSMGKGFTFRYATREPHVGMFPDDLLDGIAFSIDSVSLENGSGTWDLDMGGEGWDLVEEENSIRYSMHGMLFENGTEEGGEVEVEVRFSTEVLDGARKVSYQLKLEGVEDGELRIGYRYSLENGGGACFSCNDKETGRLGGNRFSFRNDRGDEVGSASWDGTALIRQEQNSSTIDVETEGELVENEVVLDLSMQISSDVASIETGGTLEFLDGFIEAFGKAADDTRDYLVDHIYSVLIGGAVMVVVIIIAISLLGRKGGRDDSDGLDLRKNRYYRGDQDIF